MFASACGAIRNLSGTVENASTGAVNAIDDAIDMINNAQSDWQQVLRDLERDLVEEGQSTLRNEVAVLTSRAISQTGVEARCNADFLRDRVVQGLTVIKAKFLGDELPPAEPAICQVVPIAVDRDAVPQNITQLEFYGYDLDLANGLGVNLERTTGSAVNVTSHLAYPSRYAMTLPFGAAGVQLDDRSKRFRLDWSGRTISTIAVIQPQTPVCESKTAHVDVGAVTFQPSKKGSGDRDFDGNGPKVRATVTLHRYDKKLTADIYMRAAETDDDWSRAEGTKTVDIYNTDPGWRIESISGNTSDTHTYTDTDHENDSFEIGSGGPVKRFVYVGDTDGDDAGRDTQVTVTFNRITLVLVQDTDCISDQAVFRLPAILITDATRRRLEPLARAQEALRINRPVTPISVNPR
jgi:hypothetical protein